MDFSRVINVSLPQVDLRIVDGCLVIVMPLAGSTINGEVLDSIHNAVTERVSGEFTVLIDRSADYTLSPVEAFNKMNSFPLIQAIAVVSSRGISKTTLNLDKALCTKPLNFFTDKEAAIEWLSSYWKD